MQFRIDSRIYDEDQLPSLGTGTYAEVFDLGNQSAAKIYWDKPDRWKTQKLTQLFDIGRSLAIDSVPVSIPLRPALDIDNGWTLGFSMVLFDKWVKLSSLCYHIASSSYQSSNGFQFDDETAVAASFSMFHILYKLSRFRLTIGDISASNILVNPANGNPAFIDIDSAHFQDWDSESLGTTGYVDPRLIDAGLNVKGGYQFDSQSDVFALTVVCFNLFTGMMPFMMAVSPPMSDDDFLKRRLSSLRVLLNGETCLREHGFQFCDYERLHHLERRMQALRSICGSSGRDGELLYKHFLHVLVDDGRESLIENLPDNDIRNPISVLLAGLRTFEVLRELEDRYKKQEKPEKDSQLTDTLVIGQLPVIDSQTIQHAFSDPDVLQSFLSLRAFNLDELMGL